MPTTGRSPIAMAIVPGLPWALWRLGRTGHRAAGGGSAERYRDRARAGRAAQAGRKARPSSSRLRWRRRCQASPDWIGPNAGAGQFMLAIGMACAVAALPILILLMDKLQILRRPLGQRTPRDASLGHLLIWGVVALVLADWARVGRQAALLLIFGLAALGGLLDRAARHRRRIYGRHGAQRPLVRPAEARRTAPPCAAADAGVLSCQRPAHAMGRRRAGGLCRGGRRQQADRQGDRWPVAGLGTAPRPHARADRAGATSFSG